MYIRNTTDYKTVRSVIDDWWGGRHVAQLFPKLFLQHFQDTCFVAEEDGKLVGFLVGFVSQSKPGEAYIHLAAVHPDYRNRGIASALYDHFYQVVRARGCYTVRLVTSPTNKDSIAFHTRIGYQIEPGDGIVDSVPVILDYDGAGTSRVRFTLNISEQSRD